MKTKQLLLILTGLLLATSLTMTACKDNKNPPDETTDTTVEDTGDVTDPEETTGEDSTDTDEIITGENTDPSDETDPIVEPDTDPSDETDPVVEPDTDPSDETDPVVEPDTDLAEPTAESLGLPVEGNNYVIGATDSLYNADAQREFLENNAADYIGKTFILYGYMGEDSEGNYMLGLGEHSAIWVKTGDLDVPLASGMLKVTAVYDEVMVQEGEMEYTTYCMIANAIEAVNAENTESTENSDNHFGS